LTDVLFSVMIVNWNGKEFLGRCIDSVISQSIPRTHYEVIVVDNASSDGSAEYVRENYPDVVLIESTTNRGFAGGNNDAFKVGRGRYFALLNNDAIADCHWLEAFKGEFENHPETAIISSKIFAWDRENAAFDESNVLSASWPKLDAWSGWGGHFVEERPRHKVDYATGAAMALRRSVYCRIGGLDEAYFMYYEDADLCARAIRAGFDIMYVPAAKAWHRMSASTFKRGSGFLFRVQVRNRIRFVLKNFDAGYLIAFAILYFMEIAEKAALLGLWDLFVFFKKLSRNGTGASSPGIEFFWAPEVRNAPYAVWWNLSNLRETLARRKQDNGRAGSRRYNENLPLRNMGGTRLSLKQLLAKGTGKLVSLLKTSKLSPLSVGSAVNSITAP